MAVKVLPAMWRAKFSVEVTHMERVFTQSVHCNLAAKCVRWCIAVK